MYFQEELETLPREQLRELQLKRVQDLVKYVYERVPLYTERFDNAGVKPEDLKTLDDLRTQALNDMKGEELSEALTAYGASLEHNLSSSAMNRMPASKIVNSSTN